MDPLATNPSGHKGLAQWDARRQSNFARFAGYRMGAGSGVPADKQFKDMLSFMLTEPEFLRARDMMAKAHSLAGATAAFQMFDEVVYNASTPARVKFAQQALAAVSNNTTTQNSSTATHDYRFGDINITSPANTGVDMARDMRRALASQPLLGPLATATVSLATRGSQ